MHMDGTPGAAAFVDASRIDRPVKTYGTPTTSSAQAKFGATSALFDVASNWLRMPSGPEFAFAGDFTIEFWLYLTANNLGYQGFVSAYTSGDSTGWACILESNNTLTFLGSVGSGWGLVCGSAVVPSTGAWHHVAAVRSGTAVRTYLDGVQAGSATSDIHVAPGHTLEIGNYAYFPGGRKRLAGYIDELRITNGVARYTAAFTPPTAAFS
jgi:hypothetical protein